MTLIIGTDLMYYTNEDLDLILPELENYKIIGILPNGL